MTSPALYRLIYVSSATVELSLVQLNQLLQRARTKNAALEITGLLLYCDGSFLQLLEGPQGAVEQLYRS
ncbi:MAG TPA: BLUF domain-containing protein, partial [Gammaproteobacteria bacterium]